MENDNFFVNDKKKNDFIPIAGMLLSFLFIIFPLNVASKFRKDKPEFASWVFQFATILAFGIALICWICHAPLWISIPMSLFAIFVQFIRAQSMEMQ